MKQLGLLFGNTAQSVAAVTAAFFIGIAAGSYLWGERLRRIENPLRVYAWLEVGIVTAALLYFAIFEVWSAVYQPLFSVLGDVPGFFLGVKVLLAMLLICPATFLMGGTLPVMGQHLVREASQLGRWSGWLYGINTLGAAGGALLAGFFLPQWLGFNRSYVVALVISSMVAAVAFALSRKAATPAPDPVEVRAPKESVVSLEHLQVVAFVSGFTSLALQVLWTRMFAQVLQNSVYTFAAILTVFLLALALGAFVARLLAERLRVTAVTLTVLLCVAATAVLLVPPAFMAWTNDLRYQSGIAELDTYLLQVAGLLALLVGLPTMLLGIILPYLYKYAEVLAERPGFILGRLNSWNTVGAVMGSLCAGFVLLETLGLWSSIRLMVAVYLLTAVLFHLRTATGAASPRLAYVPLGIMLLALTVLDPGRYPVVNIQPLDRNEALLEVWEGSGGTVAVIKRNDKLRVKLNNWYSLGGVGARNMEEMQSHLPLQLHPEPKSVFYLGLGSGITAGTAMQYPVEEVVVAELVSDVIAASRKYFEPYTNGLFDDDRVRIVHEDGRNYLRASDESFDLIIADLFIPWKSGVGYLYTQEHFQTAKSRLNAGGMFIQWIPLYQISERELGIIGKTMLSAFDRVTVWRGDFKPEKPMLALIGHTDVAPLDPSAQLAQLSKAALADYRSGEADKIPLIAHYVGQLTPENPILRDRPLSTDDLPWIEYLAPQAHRAEKAGAISWFVGKPYLRFMQETQQLNEPDSDEYLSELDNELQRSVYAGLLIHLAQTARSAEQEEAADKAMRMATQILTGS